MLELLVVVAIVALLSGLLLPAMAKARMRTQASACLNNLKYLGTAGTMYEYDNGGKMPYAGLRLQRGVEMTWDDLIDPYMGGKLTPAERWGGLYTGPKMMPYLRCPSDHVPAATQLFATPCASRRSYAMPRYHFDRETSRWPPNVQSRTGLGLYWSFDDDGTPEPGTLPTWNTVDRTDGDGTAAHPYPRKQWAMRSNLILQPTETILLTERIHAGNLRGSVEVAGIDYPDQHCERGKAALDDGRVHEYAPASVYHNSFFDYLMVDGHAELLDPQATVRPGSSLKAQSGMWTIVAGD